MRITRIDIEGRPAYRRVHHVQADSADDLWSMAECLQYHLDGHEGDETAVHGYLLVIKQLAE